MRLINSAAFGISQEITSIERALLLLGPKQVRKEATSIVTKQMAKDKPPENITICQMRAFFCEALGGLTKSTDAQLDLFMMGIVSGLPAMLDVPLIKLLDELSIGDEIRAGLRGQTAMGKIFKLTKAHENSEFSAMTETAKEHWISINTLSKLYQTTAEEVQAIVGDSGGAAKAA